MEISLNYPLAGLDDFDWSQVASGVTDIVKQAAPVVLAAQQQRALQKINVARASQGLPAMDVSKYAEASAPVVKVQGGMDSSTRTLMWGLGLGTLGVLGFLGYMAVGGRRRSRGR